MKNIKSIAAPVVAAVTGYDVSKLKISVEEFNTLKGRYGHLYVIDVVIDEDETYQFIVRRPDRAILSAIADKKNDIDAGNDLIIKNLLLAGDKDALDDGLVFACFMKEAGKMMGQSNSFFSKA